MNSPGIIGPKRLNDARIVPTVDYTARVMGKLLEREKKAPVSGGFCVSIRKLARALYAAIWFFGAAFFTSASTCASKRLKFASNMPTSFFAVFAKAALSCQVFTG